MKYLLDINDRPFKAILAGTKKVEGRCPKPGDKFLYSKLEKGDLIIFQNNVTNEILETEVLFVHHYPDVKEMLETERVENVISSEPKTIEHGIEGYKEGIKKNGIYAIGIKLF